MLLVLISVKCNDKYTHRKYITVKPGSFTRAEHFVKLYTRPLLLHLQTI